MRLLDSSVLLSVSRRFTVSTNQNRFEPRQAPVAVPTLEPREPARDRAGRQQCVDVAERIRIKVTARKMRTASAVMSSDEMEHNVLRVLVELYKCVGL